MNCFVFNSNTRTASSFHTAKRGFKMKKTRASPTIAPTVRALEHFDVYYKPTFKDAWPSIRLAMLTGKKGAAVMNNFADTSMLKEKFLKNGAFDIISKARILQKEGSIVDSIKNDDQNDEQYINNVVPEEFEEMPSNNNMDNRLHEQNSDDDPLKEDDRLLNNFEKELDRKDLDAFIPVKKVYSHSELRVLEDIKQSVYSPLDVRIDVVKSPPLTIPEKLQVYCYPSGNNSPFTKPKLDRHSGFLSSFLLNASSILPVLALDLQEDEDVLDLCAAPGGKTLCMLQTQVPGSITCNDLSKSRLTRLNKIMEFYVPQESRLHVNVVRGKGEHFEGEFDKVLVDVPCNTDRQRLLDDFNNLYSPSRNAERLELPEQQKNLLVSAIQCCRVGGSVVYSTCTLAAAQNYGTVQKALDEILQTTDIKVVVEDLSELKHLFKDTFKFYDNSRFGQLVIPSISANYGPMYLCRIKRIQ